MVEPWSSADRTKDTVDARRAEQGIPAHKECRLRTFQMSEVDQRMHRNGAAEVGA
ncbi:DNA-binding protein [Rathayibacter sp. AY2B3]|nr:DNA-binding protein [Rathayibacter sp. AY2B3]